MIHGHRLVALSLTAITGLSLSATAADWPQWRGPERNGIAPAGPALVTNWPPTGPALVWKSEKIPTYNEGGIGSVAIAKGLAVIYSNWKYKDPIETRTLNDGGLRNLGWIPEKVPEETLKAIETARTSADRLALTQDKVAKWAETWANENLKDEPVKKFNGYARDRISRGSNAVDFAVLDTLATIKDKPFANQAELDKWLADNAIPEPLKKDVIRLVPTTVDKANDTVICFDAGTGTIKWKAQFAGQPTGWDTSSTPLLDSDRCYLLVSGSAFYCLSMKDGSVIWKAKANSGSGASSAALLDGKVVVVAGQLMAFDAASGTNLWTQAAVRHTHTSPVIWKSGSTNFIICSSGGGELVCVNPADGAVAWKTAPGANNSTPVISGDYAVVQGEGQGLNAFRLAPDKAEKIWSTNHNDRGSSPIVSGDHVYVVSGGGNAKAMCLKLDSGQLAWEAKIPGQEISSPILVDGKILTFVGNGNELYLFPANPAQFEVVAKAKVAGANCSSPAIVDGRLYIRTNEGVACYDLTRTAPAEPAK